MIDPVETRAPITFSQLLNQPRQSADRRIAYGTEALQFGEFWVPKSGRSRPVIVLIHGGCWRADLPGLELMDYMAADLRERGFAVWNMDIAASVMPAAVIRDVPGCRRRRRSSAHAGADFGST